MCTHSWLGKRHREGAGGVPLSQTSKPMPRKNTGLVRKACNLRQKDKVRWRVKCQGLDGGIQLGYSNAPFTCMGQNTAQQRERESVA